MGDVIAIILCLVNAFLLRSTYTVKKKNIKKESILNKIKYTFQSICDKIKMLKQKKDEVEA